MVVGVTIDVLVALVVGVDVISGVGVGGALVGGPTVVNVAGVDKVAGGAGGAW